MKRNQKERLRVLLRKKILHLASRTPTAHPHIGSCMSCIDILIQTMIYEMNHDDKFILSKGHASLALYVVLNYLKKISDQELETYFEEGTYFGIHTPSHLPKDIPLATGSLGHGLSFAAGLAKGYKLQQNLDSRLRGNDRKERKVYCLISDGECNEGSVWEAALFASHHKLDNLFVLLDKNKFQAFGKTKDVLGDAASKEKWKAFGFNIVECDGHNLTEIQKGFKNLKRMKNKKPNLLICNTIRGKGIKAIENKIISNYTAVVGDFYEKALKDVTNL